MTALSRRALLFTIATLSATAELGEDALVLEQLPTWAQQQFASLAKLRTVEVTTRINPFTWRGDFDADGVQDLAVFVRHTASKKEGIAFLRRSKAAILMGAGTELGNGGDDFAWLDVWTVLEGQEGGADRLLVAKESSASAVISLQNDKPRWQQQGD